MIGAGGFRRQQQKTKIDRLPVERVEIDRAFQSREQPEQAAELRQFAVRNSDTVTHPRRTKLFPLQQDFKNCLFALPRQLGGARSKSLDSLLFVVDLERRQNGVRRNEIGKRHGHNQ